MSIGIWSFKMIIKQKKLLSHLWLAFYITLLSLPFATTQPAAQDYELSYNYPRLEVVLRRGRSGEMSLDIIAPTQHSYEFGIEKPDGTFLFLFMKPADLMPNTLSDFGKKGKTTLNAHSLTGVEYQDGQPITKPIFDQPGLYCLHFSSNFETHPEDTYNEIFDIQWPSPARQQKGVNHGKCQDDFFRDH
jgi:hypothetical protein